MSEARQMVEDYGKAAIACALDTTAENAMNAVRLRQALISEIEATKMRLEMQRDAIERKDKILSRIARTHMHHEHCAWCDSNEHGRDCFVAAAIAEVSSSVSSLGEKQ